MEFNVIQAEQPIIKINFEEVKEMLTSKLEEYTGIVVTEDTLSGCKYAQKELASLRVNVDNERKKIKKELSAPISKFEDQCKELISMIEKVEGPIKEGIKVFDDARREEKRKVALKIIEEEAANAGLNETFKAKVEVKDKYMNLTATESDVRDDVIAQTISLKVQQNAEEDRLAIITSALDRENEKLKQKLSISDFYYDINFGRATSDILAEISRRAERIYNAENAPVEEPKAEPKAEPKEAPKEPQKMYSVTFNITGTADEMRMVSTFLKANNINYTTIEQKAI